jgi:hypothetical protein
VPPRLSLLVKDKELPGEAFLAPGFTILHTIQNKHPDIREAFVKYI